MKLLTSHRTMYNLVRDVHGVPSENMPEALADAVRATATRCMHGDMLARGPHKLAINDPGLFHVQQQLP